MLVVCVAGKKKNNKKHTDVKMIIKFHQVFFKQNYQRPLCSSQLLNLKDQFFPHILNEECLSFGVFVGQKKQLGSFVFDFFMD